MGELFVHISDDEMEVYLLVPDTFKELYPTISKILTVLDKSGVTNGIDHAKIEKIVREKICQQRILVAEGIPSTIGTAARLEMLIDITQVGKPRKRNDGSVDHKDISTIINVNAGTPLMRRIPPVKGVRGLTVTGKVTLSGDPQDITLVNCVGTVLSDNDKNLLVAEHSGAVFLRDDGFLEVHTVRKINGDVDYSTGNLDFTGDLLVTGSVRSGFIVKTSGNITIRLDVEDADIVCYGDCEIMGGLIGAKHGCVECKGYLNVHHIENFRVMVDGALNVKGSIVNSQINVKKSVNAKTIIGGTVNARQKIVVSTIGGVAETRTIITIDDSAKMQKQLADIFLKINDISKIINRKKLELFEFVRDNMSANGSIPDHELDKLIAIKLVLKGYFKELEIENKQSDLLNEKLNRISSSTLEAGTIFPNTLIRIGRVEKLVMTKLSNVIILCDGDRIIVRES